MKDIFKIAMNKSIGVGGYHCSCCNPLAKRNPQRRRDKIKLHKQARCRLKERLLEDARDDSQGYSIS